MDDLRHLNSNVKTILALSISALISLSSVLPAQTIYEVWTPEIMSQATDNTFGTSLFRKKLSLIDPEEAEVYIAAKDQFEIYVNGHAVGSGQSFGSPVKYNVSHLLQKGVNLIAAKVLHETSTTAGLAVKFRVREKGEDRWRSLTTDDTWATRRTAADNWFSYNFDDRGWTNANKLASVVFGAEAVQVGTVGEFNGSQQLASAGIAETFERADVDETAVTKNRKASRAPENSTEQQSAMEERFDIDPEFKVEQVLSDSETGSIIAMAFNEFGQLILSKEGGPLMIADVTKKPGDPQRIRTLCNDVNSCQGILPLNGKVYVTGDGPSGQGVYRLADDDRNGIFKVDKMLVQFAGGLGEHGPHAVRLGPDGLIHVVIGNASKSISEPAKTSPYINTYEGDLIPRIEDPGGHAVGTKAPGGTIIRLTLDGSVVETVCGGIRNAYDFAFDKYGELFLHDSDLETNIGMAWYRPTRMYHVPNGAELGWRSGWAKFPNYFTDVTPPVAETGRGSPSGAVLYQHFQFPARYHNALFFADWSEGRILAARPTEKGAGYDMDVEVFVTGRPMNVTDLDVGVDGTLFFSTGGRGTSGGVYRIAWNGTIPDELYNFDNDFEQVIRMPQPNSAWSRQATALLKRDIGDKWAESLSGIAIDTRNDISYRLRAIEVMFFYGPFPGDELIQTLAGDEDHRIRARIASLCGTKVNKSLNEPLEELISDQHPLVRRKAAESWLRLPAKPPVKKVIAMLGSEDRTEAAVARRLLERLPAESFRKTILTTPDAATFINGSIALLTAHPGLDNAYKVLARVTHFMDGYLSDIEFADVLRVSQIALFQGKVSPSKIQGFADRIDNEFPAGNGVINKQLAMIMAYMKNGDVEDRIEDYFENSDNSEADKLFVAMQLQSIGRGLNDKCRFAVIDYLEKSFRNRDGSTYRTYVSTAIKDLARNCSQYDQIQVILENGARWPNAMLQSFFAINKQLNEQQVEWVIAADQNMEDGNDLTTRRIRMGAIAVLAESQSPVAFEYLRSIWKSRPSFRNEISLGLAQEPAGDNWPYLVTSIPVLDDTIGKEVVQALAQVNRRPKQPRQYRELIEMGYRLRDKGAIHVSSLLQHWTSNEEATTKAPQNSWRAAMDHWTEWYAQRWPEELQINLEPLPKIGNYTAEQVLAHLEEHKAQGAIGTGRYVFRKANCNACHRIGGEGASFGPDLTNLASRFSRREILEAIIHPSRVVSDQYRSKKILTVDGEQLFGMLTRDSSGAYLLLDPEGRTTRVSEDDIEEIADSDLSSMPEGTLDELSLEEILHLFSYLYESKSNMSTAQSSDGSVAR